MAVPGSRELGVRRLINTGRVDYDLVAIRCSLTSHSSVARSGVGTLHCLVWISVRVLPSHTHLYLRWFWARGRTFQWLLSKTFVVVGTIHGPVESTKLASLQIPNEDGNQDSEKAVAEVQYTENYCEFGLGEVLRVGAGVILTVAAAGRHGTGPCMDLFLVAEN
jgi:hypothetical protein